MTRSCPKRAQFHRARSASEKDWPDGFLQIPRTGEQREDDASEDYDVACLRKNAAMADFFVLPWATASTVVTRVWLEILVSTPFNSKNVSAAAAPTRLFPSKNGWFCTK